jgi:hypothetical protein
MRFFKFGKRNSQISSNTEKRPVTERPPNTKTPVVPSAQKEIHKPVVSSLPENKKEDIADFFTINIYDIFQYDPKPVRKGKGANGCPVEIFEVTLSEPELSTFFKVEILQYENKQYDLVFISKINEIKDDLKEFIDFSCEAFGPDFMNKGSFHANDLRDAVLGVFSRIWYNKARIDNTSFTLTLILFNITPKQEKIIRY